MGTIELTARLIAELISHTPHIEIATLDRKTATLTGQAATIAARQHGDTMTYSVRRIIATADAGYLLTCQREGDR